MYGPIANLPGYNPNATYLPPGIAAPSSYPERVPQPQTYAPLNLPKVVDQGITDLAAQGGLSSSDPNSSLFGGFGIAGGIGGNAGGVDSMYGFVFPNNGSMDGQEYAWLNNFLAGQTKPATPAKEQMVPPNFSGPSNDQYSGDYLVPPTFGGPQQWSFENYNRQPQTKVSAQEEGQGWIGGQPDYGYSGFPQSMQGFGLPSLESLADKNGVINTYSTTSQPGLFSSRWFDSLSNMPDSFTMGNAAQLGINALLPAGLSQMVSAGAGALGIGTNDTGNPILNHLAQPAFGVGTSNLPRLPEGSQVMTDRGATAFDPSMYGNDAERSLAKAYSSTASYDPISGSYVDGASPASVSAMAAPTDFGGTFGNGEYQPWYSENPNLFSLTGNMLENASWGPGTKYVMNPFDTN